MTAAEVQSIIKSADKIDKNVFNFFPAKYKKYEPLFVTKKGPLTMDGNSLIDRDTLIEYIKDHHPSKRKYREELLPIYDEIKYRMEWYDVVAIYSSSMQPLHCERYDLNNVEVFDENVYTVLDRDTGELVYMASDQTTSVIRYAYNQEAEEINPKDGMVETVKCNQGLDKYGTEKHRVESYYNS